MERMSWIRPTRGLTAALLVLAAAPLLLAVGASAARAQEIRVTLLGTGTPVPSITRFGPSILVQAGRRTLLFDAGRGAVQRLAQLGVAFKDVDAVFLTHLHSDHVVGLPDLWLTGWLVGRRTAPLELYGPAGTADMAARLAEAFAFDVRMRLEDDRRAPEGGRLVAHEVGQGVVYDSDGVKITAFEVDHGPVKPAFGYRIEYGGRVVVLSGDTRYSRNVIANARGADLLVHEVVLAPPDMTPADPRYRAYAHHTTPEQAGEVFAAAKPKLAVYSHILSGWGLPDSALVPRTRRTYAGRVEVGEDLMQIDVGDEVTVRAARLAGH